MVWNRDNIPFILIALNAQLHTRLPKVFNVTRLPLHFFFTRSLLKFFNSVAVSNSASTGVLLGFWRQLGTSIKNFQINFDIFFYADFSNALLLVLRLMLNISLFISLTYLFCLVWWRVTTWPIRWSDLCTWCATLIFLVPCLVHLSSDLFNIYFSFSLVVFRTWSFWPCRTIPADVTSFQATETCGLA